MKRPNRATRILIATSAPINDIGGPATFTQKLEQWLIPKGYSTDIQPAVWRGKTFSTYFHYSIRLIKASLKNDIIFTLEPSFIGLSAYFASILTRRPLLVRFSGDAAYELAYGRRQTNDTLEDFHRVKQFGRYARILIIMQRFVLKRARKIIVPSKYLKSILITHYKISSREISIINNTAPNEVPLLTKRKNKNPTLITVARLVRLKGIDGIIRVVGKLTETNKNIKLLIIGAGAEEDGLKGLTNKLNLRRNVVFKGKLTRQKVMRYLQNADLFILNSHYEAMPNIILECFACGIPVIATRIEGVTSECIKDGENGMLVTLGSDFELETKIQTLLDNPSLRRAIANKARVKLSEYSQSKTFSKLEKIINNL